MNDVLKDLNTEVRDWIKFAEGKNAAIIGLLVLLLKMSIDLSMKWTISYACVATIGILALLIINLASFIPFIYTNKFIKKLVNQYAFRNKSKAGNKRFFCNIIADYDDYESYKKTYTEEVEYKEMTVFQQKSVEAYLLQIYELSLGICFKHSVFSLTVYLLGFVLFIVVLVA